MRTPALFVTALALAACGQQGSTKPAPASTVRFGVYSFTEHPDGIKEPIQGRVLVREDTVVVELVSRDCRYFTHSDPTKAYVYDCGDVSLVFDRREPITGARYQATKTVRDQQQTCTRYTTDKNGNQVCAQTTTEPIDRRVPVNGALRLSYIANP